MRNMAMFYVDVESVKQSPVMKNSADFNFVTYSSVECMLLRF